MHDAAPREELDRAIRARLAKLAEAPVDTDGLEKRFRASLVSSQVLVPRSPWRGWRRMAAAACVLVVAGMSAFLMLGTRPVLAAPGDLAGLHAETTAPGEEPVQVSSLEEATRELSCRCGSLPRLPAPPSGGLYACCVHNFLGRKVACLLLKDGGTPLTIMVGHAKDFRLASGRPVEIQGCRFMLHEVDGVRMAVTQHDGRYVCIMGEIPEARLLEMAGGMRL